MAAHLIHPQLAQALRAIGHRIGAWAVPDDEPPTLVLEQPVHMAAARPLHRIPAPLQTPACLGDSCRQGRSQCRTPEACYTPARHQPTTHAPSRGRDTAHAALLVLCVVILVVWLVSALAGIGWADALRVLASFTGA